MPPPKARRIVDAVQVQVVNLMADLRPAEVSDAIWKELTEAVAALANDSEVAAGSIHRSGAAAAEFIEEAISVWSGVLAQEPHWSKAKALYISRRFPWTLIPIIVMGPDLPEEHGAAMIAGTERLLTIDFGAESRGEDEIWIQETAVFPVTNQELEAFIRRTLRTAHLWLLHNTARVVGKGCDLHFKIGDPPAAEVSNDLQAALDLYDARLRETGVVGITGTRVWVEGTPDNPMSVATCHHREGGPSDEVVAPEITARLKTDAAAWGAHDLRRPPTPGRRGPRGSSRSVGKRGPDSSTPDEGRLEQAAPFDIAYLDLTPMAELAEQVKGDSDAWWEPELPAVLALCCALRSRSGDAIFTHQLRHFGYIRVSREELFDLLNQTSGDFRTLLKRVLPDAHCGPHNVMALLKTARGQLFPVVDGPVIRRSPDGMLLVDILTAGRRLAWLLTAAKAGGGSVGEARGFHFEALVQAEIDRLGFGPRSPELRSIIGKDLKRGGKVITDIDGIAVLANDATLLVQAKSYPYDKDYGAGRYRAVTNRRTTVEKDVLKWQAKIEEITAGQSGSDRKNYQLPEAVKFEWVVVTPFPVFLQRPLCDEEALPGLRRVSSLDELTRWLIDSGTG